MKTLIFAAMAALALSGCKKKEETPAPEQPATTPEKTVATPPEKEPPMVPPPIAGATMANKMANCPSAVKGASTTMKVEGEDVVLTIVASDEGAAKTIRERATTLASQEAKDTKAHTGQGTGGRTVGKCPAAIQGTTLNVAEVDKGVTVTLTGKPSAEVSAEVDRRIKLMVTGKSGKGHGQGTGGGKSGDRSGTGGGKGSADQ